MNEQICQGVKCKTFERSDELDTALYKAILLPLKTYLLHLTRFNKIAIQGTPQMAVDKEARAYRESTHIVILTVPCPYTKCNLP